MVLGVTVSRNVIGLSLSPVLGLTLNYGVSMVVRLCVVGYGIT